MITDKQLKDWIAALRSGDYKQGCKALCVEDDHGQRSYCCLGVLADLVDSTWNKQRDEEDVVTWLSRGEHHDQFLPGDMVDDDVQALLSELNDFGSTFEEIADRIERDGIVDIKPWLKP